MPRKKSFLKSHKSEIILVSFTIIIAYYLYTLYIIPVPTPADLFKKDLFKMILGGFIVTTVITPIIKKYKSKK